MPILSNTIVYNKLHPIVLLHVVSFFEKVRMIHY